MARAQNASRKDMTQKPHLFCFGLGYSALALARALLEQGWAVTGTCRDIANAREAQALGIEIVIFDRARPIPDKDPRLRTATHLLSSVPPDEKGDPVLDVHGEAIAKAAIAETGGRLQWIGYLSTTGVYGDRQGGWVDESSALTPTGERGKRRLTAET